MKSKPQQPSCTNQSTDNSSTPPASACWPTCPSTTPDMPDAAAPEKPETEAEPPPKSFETRPKRAKTCPQNAETTAADAGMSAPHAAEPAETAPETAPAAAETATTAPETAPERPQTTTKKSKKRKHETFQDEACAPDEDVDVRRELARVADGAFAMVAAGTLAGFTMGRKTRLMNNPQATVNKLFTVNVNVNSRMICGDMIAPPIIHSDFPADKTEKGSNLKMKTGTFSW